MVMKKNIRLNLSQRTKKIVIFLLFIFVFVVLNFSGFSKDIKNFFFLASSPIQQSFLGASRSFTGLFGGFSEKINLQKEIKRLEFKNQELVSQIIFLFELKKENDFLRKNLGLGLEDDFDLLLARMISKDIIEDSILINKGKRDGVLEGMVVVAGEKVLLGRIGEVYENFSEVVLISNKKSSFDIKIIRNIKEDDLPDDEAPEPSEVYGMAKGAGNFEILLDLIPKEDEFFKEDIVATSALGGIYPAGFLVGRVNEIKTSDLDPFQKAEVEPSFDINSLDYLFIIKNR